MVKTYFEPEETEIGEKLRNKLKEIASNEDQYKMMIQLLVKVKRAASASGSFEKLDSSQNTKLKKEFQLLLEQYFPLEDMVNNE